MAKASVAQQTILVEDVPTVVEAGGLFRLELGGVSFAITPHAFGLLLHRGNNATVAFWAELRERNGADFVRLPTAAPLVRLAGGGEPC